MSKQVQLTACQSLVLRIFLKDVGDQGSCLRSKTPPWLGSICWAQLLLLDWFWLHKNPISWGRGGRMTQRLEYLQWLGEDCVKSLLCFIWSQLNLSCVTWCKCTSPGNVLTTGGCWLCWDPFPIRFCPSVSGWAGRFFPESILWKWCVSHKKFQFWEIGIFFPPALQKNGKTQTSLVGKCLTRTCTELWWGQLTTCLLPAFVSFYFKTVWELLFWQEIAKKAKAVFKFSCSLHRGQFWNNLYIEDVVSTTYWTHWTSPKPNLPALHKHKIYLINTRTST